VSGASQTSVARTTLALFTEKDMADQGNGNRRAAEWAWRLGTALLAAVLAYAALGAKVSVLEERQRNQYDELIRRLDRIEGKLP
jgi:hypothetical protein